MKSEAYHQMAEMLIEQVRDAVEDHGDGFIRYQGGAVEAVRITDDRMYSLIHLSKGGNRVVNLDCETLEDVLDLYGAFEVI